ncbi:hypothetical protein CSPX01_06086 [Colletotrichum filicis]|nr:hypothetical protein CSPX01_06086 [Colletotrichum filicis]
MSGFEIAGAVLGGFPILLNCIDYYHTALEPMDNWWHFRDYFIHFVDDIRHQRMKYHENLIRLLDPIIPDNESLITLIGDPTDVRWKDGSLEDHLKDRFPSELDRFLRTIERMHEVMLELYKILQIQDGKAPWLGTAQHNPVQWYCKRLQLSLSKGKHRKVQKLDQLNQTLRDMVGFSERTLPISDRRKSSSPVRRLESARQHACRVYETLRDHWRCHQGCNCHKAHLRLCGDSSPETLSMVLVWGTGDNTDSSLKPKAYEVMIQNTKDRNPTTSTDIRAVHGSATLSHIQSITEQKTQYIKSRPSFLDRVSHRLQPKPAAITGSTQSAPPKNVKFLEPSPTICITPSENEAAMKNGGVSLPCRNNDERSSRQKIENLCAFLEETSWNEGVLHDEFDRHLVFNKDSSDLRRIIPGKLRLLSLTELLEAHHQADITLSRQSRFEIAAHISAALLNTYPSPWMPSSWTKSSFYFLVDDETLLSCHPFLSNTFELDKEESSLSEESTSPKNISEQTARDYLFTVGVIVLELIFGHDIGHCRFRKDYLQDNRPNELTDMLTAQRWAKKVLGESGPNIADVVRRCLDCSFGPRPVLSDVRFRESIYEGVIKPLASYAKIWPEVMV